MTTSSHGSLLLCTYFSGITEVLERCSQDLHCLLVLVKEGDDKMEKIAFPHVIWRLLLEVYHGQVVVRIRPAYSVRRIKVDAIQGVR